jgi:hypothetical protein
LQTIRLPTVLQAKYLKIIPINEGGTPAEEKIKGNYSSWPSMRVGILRKDPAFIPLEKTTTLKFKVNDDPACADKQWDPIT